MPRRLLFIQACTLLCVGAIHLAALNFYLYWLFPWLDTAVHFLGGLWAMLFAYSLFLFFRVNITATRVFVLLACMAFGWELFELWAGAPREANFAFDTTVDLIMDGLGGVFGYFVAKRVIAHATIANHDSSQEDSSTPPIGAA